MPDVGMFTAGDPLPKNAKVIIRYSVEVEGLPVYNESYDTATLAKELEKDEAKVVALWARRLKCAVAARSRPGFSASLTRCLTDGLCGDYGHKDCEAVDSLGHP